MRRKYRRRSVFPLALAALLLLSGAAGGLYYHQMGPRKQALFERAAYYRELAAGEAAWLSSIQLENGAIPFRGETHGEASITPYFSDIAAWGLLEGGEYRAVRDYIQWHMAHLNDVVSDYSGIAGTIYDYTIEVDDGKVVSEKSERHYDSVDSYAATFLILISEYCQRTGDEALFRQYQDQVLLVLGAMERTIDRDGLSFTKPDYLVKYLMDNAEVYAALGCMESLLERYPVPDGKRILTRLRQRRTSLNERLEALLWNQGERRYETGADAKGKTLAVGGWQEFYPDATAQLFPILFGLLEPASQRAQEIYQRFCREHAWQEMEHYATGNASFYWGLVAYAGAKMGDEERVYQYMEYYRRCVLPDRDYPLYCGDAGWIILACGEMARWCETEMERIDPLGLVQVQ